MNLRSDDKFVEDESWHQAAQQYKSFLRIHSGKVSFLELGVGYNTPVIIKYPFWQMTAQNLTPPMPASITVRQCARRKS